MGQMGPITAINNDSSDITDTTLKGVGINFPYYLNGYFEVDKTKAPDDTRRIAYTKRSSISGAAFANITLSATYNGYKIQGVTTSLDKSKILFYLNSGTVNRTAYYDGATMTISAGNAPAAAGNWTFTGPVVWTVLDGISYGANVFYAVTDFTKGAVVNATGTWTEITDADFTGLTKVTNIIGLDGYLFVGTSNNRIYNSDLNTGTSWTATSFLTASDTPGNLIWLGRIRNYLIAFKQFSLEFFEDTGNPTPGSPLTSQKPLRKSIGLASKSSVQYVSDGIIFIGQTDRSYVGVYKLHYTDLSLTKISDYFVDSLMNLCNTYSTNTTYSVDSLLDSTGSVGESRIVTYKGKEFYLLDVTGMAGSTKRTYVFDNELGVWTTWNTWFKTAGASTTGIFDPSQGITFNTSTGGGFSACLMVNNYTASINNTPPQFMMFDILNTGSSYVDDDGVGSRTYPFVWVGDIQDFGTRKRKFLDSLEILLELSNNAISSGTSSFTLYYRDNNFNDSSVAGVSRTITYPDNGSGRAIVRRLGSFRKRQFGLLDVTNTLTRILGIQCQFNVGETDQQS